MVMAGTVRITDGMNADGDELCAWYNIPDLTRDIWDLRVSLPETQDTLIYHSGELGVVFQSNPPSIAPL
jgi:hypothetical protein